MALPDQDTGMVDGFGQTKLEHLGLKSALEEVFHPQAEDEIEFHLVLVKYTYADETSEESITCKESRNIRAQKYCNLFLVCGGVYM